MQRKRFRARRSHGGRMVRRRRGRYRKARLTKRLPALTGFPNKKLVRLRYTETVQINPGIGSIASYYFCANGMYDPNVTGTGHQPLCFDQWGTIYDHYYVLGSKIRATFINGSAGELSPGAFGIILDDNATFTYGTTDEVLESKQGAGAVILAGATTNGRTRSATKTFSHRKFFGSKHLIGQEQYKGNFGVAGTGGANPSEKANFGVWCGAISGNDPDSMGFIVTVEYIALCTEPKFISQS